MKINDLWANKTLVSKSEIAAAVPVQSIKTLRGYLKPFFEKYPNVWPNGKLMIPREWAIKMVCYINEGVIN